MLHSIEGSGFYANVVEFVEHIATHVDAPAHFISGGATIDEVPLDRFVGKGVVIDVTDSRPREVITLDKVLPRIRELGVELGSDWIVLFETGYSKYAGTERWFDHPGIGRDVAEFLASVGVKAVGTDAPSIDREPFEAHKVLLSRGIPIYENLANLDLVKSRPGFLFIGLPLKIVKGSASPVRAVAILEGL